MTATARHFLGFPSYIIYGALKLDFFLDATWRSLVEGLNVRIRGTSNRQSCSEWSDYQHAQPEGCIKMRF